MISLVLVQAQVKSQKFILKAIPLFCLILFILQIDDSSLVSLTSSLEPESCYQLLFCSLASEKVKIDQDVENIHKLVTSKPGKYREAHKFGKTG